MAENYSDAFLADGPLVFVSGQAPEASDGSVAEGDAVEQPRQVFRNIEATLAEQGAGIRHLAKLAYYLRHIFDLQAVRQVLNEFLLYRPLPASTLVEVTGLIDPRFLAEIDAIACLPRGDRSALQP